MGILTLHNLGQSVNCQDTFPQPFFFFLFFFLALIALTVEAHVTNTPHCRFNTVVELKEEGEKRRNHKNMGSFSKMPFANNGAPRSSTDLERRDGGGGHHGGTGRCRAEDRQAGGAAGHDRRKVGAFYSKEDPHCCESIDTLSIIMSTGVIGVHDG